MAFPEPVNRFRSADGSPGPDYWQNRADYDIAARLDPASKTLTATETITYTNNSPSALTSLWVQLDQNVYRPDARSVTALSGFRKPDQVTSGYAIEAVQVQRDGSPAPAPFLVSDTRMQVHLAEPLKSGGRLKLRIAYHYIVPGLFGGRTAWVDTKNGPIFDVAQWYPRMCVFDDVRGWDTLPYVAQEFYLEYGDVDYAVTVPADMLVMGTGELANPQEVLTPRQRERLVRARSSDSHRADPHPGRGRPGRRRAATIGGTNLALPHGRHPRRGLQRQPRLHLGRRPHRPARRPHRPGRERLSGREHRPQRLDPLHGVHQGRYRAVLPALVSLSLSDRGQHRRRRFGHGVSGAGVRRHRRQGC